MSDRSRGILCILGAALSFALMNTFVHLSGGIPTMQKAFFRNFVAVIFSFLILNCGFDPAPHPGFGRNVLSPKTGPVSGWPRSSAKPGSRPCLGGPSPKSRLGPALRRRSYSAAFPVRPAPDDSPSVSGNSMPRLRNRKRLRA